MLSVARADASQFMTILNVWCEAGRALVAVDTRPTEAGKPSCREVSKLIPVTHLNAVLAGRGNYAFFTLFGYTLLVHSTLGDFDALVRAAPELMQEAFHPFARGGGESLGADAQASIEEQYAVLVGWSPGAQRMRAFEIRWDPTTRTYDPSEFDGSYRSPWSAAIDRAHPRPDTISAMEQLARAQLHLYEEKASTWRTGGRLIVARIDRLNMLIQSVCDLEKPDAVTARERIGTDTTFAGPPALMERRL